MDPAQLRQLERLAAERGVTLSATFQEMIGDDIGRLGALTGHDCEKPRTRRAGSAPAPLPPRPEVRRRDRPT